VPAADPPLAICRNPQALAFIYPFGREPILIFHEKIAHDSKSVKSAMWRTEALCIGMKAI